MFFTFNHFLCSTCVQHAKTFAKHLRKCFSVYFTYTHPKNIFACFANVFLYM